MLKNIKKAFKRIKTNDKQTLNLIALTIIIQSIKYVGKDKLTSPARYRVFDHVYMTKTCPNNLKTFLNSEYKKGMSFLGVYFYWNSNNVCTSNEGLIYDLLKDKKLNKKMLNLRQEKIDDQIPKKHYAYAAISLINCVFLKLFKNDHEEYYMDK